MGFDNALDDHIYRGSLPPTPCDLLGHLVDEWSEYLDGVCVGHCNRCYVRVASTRMPGGMPFLRLKAAVELLIAAPGSADAALEVVQIAESLEEEERALVEARSLLDIAREMASCQQG